jgi:hypothetical protein
MPSRARLLVAAVATSMAVVIFAAVALAGATASATATTSGCAWANQIGAGGIQGFGADLDAGYWITSFLAIPGTTLTLSGSFPQARYMSISAYNTGDASIEPHLYDAEIDPATGANPFQSGVDPSATGTYQVQIVAQSPGTSAPNTLSVGTNNDLVYVMYRVYDPDDPSDPTGGAGIPQAQSTSALGVMTPLAGCVTPASTPSTLPAGLGSLASGIGSLPSPSTGEPNWAPATVTRLPDPDTGYMAAAITQTPGQVVVFRAQMPTFPDMNAGTPPWQPGVDVRYWSICEYERTALDAAACVADHDAVQSAAGVATFVVSTPQDQPANATAADGVNWLPWGDATDGLIVYRQILATFPQSIDATFASASLPAAMGPYYPQIAYCSVTEFTAEGATGCLDPAPGPTGTGTNPPTATTGAGTGTTASGTTGAGRTGSGTDASSGTNASGASSGTNASGASARGRLSRAALMRALAPEIAPTGKGARITTLLDSRGYTFAKYKLPTAGRLQLSWWYHYGKRHGRMLVAAGTIALSRRLTGALRMKLTVAGRKLLAGVKSAGMTGVASYAPAGAAKLTLDRTFTLKR